MRLFFLAACFLTASLFVSAQRFYYVASDTMMDQLLKSWLQKSSQYVVASAMASEYTVHTEIKSGENERELNLEIVLSDSLTQKEIYRSREQFCFSSGKAQPELLYTAAIQGFLHRRILSLMNSAAQDHTGTQQTWLRARRDRT